VELKRMFQQRNFLLVGDIMLDVYYKGEVKHISPEAPVPVFKKSGEKFEMGGAANVAMNLVAANQKVSIFSIIGDDEKGAYILEALSEYGVDTEYLVKTNRCTTVKTRFLAENNQQVLRVDIEETQSVSDELINSFISVLEKRVTEFDIVLISDYMKGLLTYEFTQKIINIANKHQIRVIVDVKDQNAKKYKNAYLLKPNLNELYLLSKVHASDKSEIISAAKRLREENNVQYILTSRGSKGMILVGKEEIFSVQSVAKEVYDVTGAGDTTLAYLAVALANEIPINEAVRISNVAAGIQVGKLGTSTVNLLEVNEYLNGIDGYINQKLLKRSEIRQFRSSFIEKKLVFTNGCFDILHVGHVKYLHEAAKLGDILIIGINSDESIHRMKGEGRPVNTEEDRVALLCALECVDYVVVFEEDTPYELIQDIRPDVLVKGGDYKVEEVVGRDIVEARDGQIRILPYIDGKSTTKMIERIRGEI